MTLIWHTSGGQALLNVAELSIKSAFLGSLELRDAKRSAWIERSGVNVWNMWKIVRKCVEWTNIFLTRYQERVSLQHCSKCSYRGAPADNLMVGRKSYLLIYFMTSVQAVKDCLRGFARVAALYLWFLSGYLQHRGARRGLKKRESSF